MRKFILALRTIAALIFLQTLWFKFTAAPESVAIFTQLHAEPFGRIFSGVCELIAAILLLLPQTQIIGALMGFGIISGAILSHIFILGLVVQGDGGLLFALACVVFLCCALIIILQRDQLKKLPVVGRFLP